MRNKVFETAALTTITGGLAMFWLVVLTTFQVVRMVYTVGCERVARRAAVKFPDWLPGNR